METPIDALKEKLRFLKEVTKQTHPTFRKYDKHIPIYEKAIEILKEAETSKKPALNIPDVIKLVCEHDWNYKEKLYVKICRKCNATYLC